MYYVMRRYHFESAHWLPNVPEGHKCKRMHGHNYELEIFVRSNDLNAQGFVIDFWELDKIVQPFVDILDHKTINDTIDNPTAELIAQWFFGRIKIRLPKGLDLYVVRVWETKDCCAIINNEWE